MPRAARSAQPLRAATYETLLGLLAATGLRVGEALRLDRDDINVADGGPAHPPLEVRQVAPGAACTPARWRRSSATSTAACSSTRTRPPRAVFVSLRGTRVIYECVWPTFRRLCAEAASRRRQRDHAEDPRLQAFLRRSHAARLVPRRRRRPEPPGMAIDLPRPRRAPLHLHLPLGRARAARLRRPTARRRQGARAMTLDRADAAGVLHRPPHAATAGQPAHDRVLPRHAQIAARLRPRQPPASSPPAWTGTTSTSR